MIVKSNKLEVSQRVEFSCCYLYNDPDSTVLQPHTYKFEATVNCDNSYDNFGVVFSFSRFKQLCKDVVPDGCYIYNTNFDTMILNFSSLGKSFDKQEELVYKSLRDIGVRCIGLPYMISTERLLSDISSKLIVELKNRYPHVYLVETKLRENTNSIAIWKNEEVTNANADN